MVSVNPGRFSCLSGIVLETGPHSLNAAAPTRLHGVEGYTFASHEAGWIYMWPRRTVHSVVRTKCTG